MLRFEEGMLNSFHFLITISTAVTVAFGVRNFENLETGLIEMLRVLKPGGVMMVLEFSHPTKFPGNNFTVFIQSTLFPWLEDSFKKQPGLHYLPESYQHSLQGRVPEHS